MQMSVNELFPLEKPNRELLITYCNINTYGIPFAGLMII
jgi:hypothetical protein